VTPEARARLRSIIDRELDAPGEPERFFRGIEEAFPDLEPAVRLWTIRDEDHRSTFYVKSESVWYRRFGFRMMRPLFALAIAAAIVLIVAARYTTLGQVVDPTIALACFLAGAFAFYATLQGFAHRWAKKDIRMLDELRGRYRLRLERLRDELDEKG